jgi:hypothetical protein
MGKLLIIGVPYPIISCQVIAALAMAIQRVEMQAEAQG